MALRRPILPSRLTGAPAPDGGTVSSVAAQHVEQQSEKTTPTTATTPIETPVASPAPKVAQAVGALASSVFSTLPTVSSQVPSAVESQPAPEPEPAPQPAEAEKPALTGTSPFAGWEAEQAAATQSVVQEESTTSAMPELVQNAAPVPELPAEELQPATEKEPVAQEESHISESAPALPPVPVAPLELPAETVDVPAFVPQGPTNFLDEPNMQASRPNADNALKRRVREKRPRDFGAATQVTQESKQQDNKPRVAFASNVPVDSRPLDKVDEALIATGIMAGPAADSLTTAVPTGLAVEERDEPAFVPREESAPQSVPVIAQSEPEQPAGEEPATIPSAPPPPPRNDRVRVDLNAPLPEAKVTAPKFTWVDPAAETEKEPESAPSKSRFSLSRKAEKEAEPTREPAKTEESPSWQTPASSGEWDLPAPVEPQPEAWPHEGAPMGPDGMATPSQLPPPADVYRPESAFTATHTPPWGASGAGSAHLPPPELPGGTSKPIQNKSGGMFSWGMALAALAAVGVVALVYMRPSGQPSGGVKSLAQLTPAQPSSTSFVALAPAPAVVSSGSLLPVASSVSSTAQIAFADVDPTQANQPIVATGKESIPQELVSSSTSGGFMARLQSEIAKARAEKEGQTVAGTPSATTATNTPAEAPLTPEALKKELEAYRRTLASSDTPIKPAAFKKATQDYMDGTATTADASPMGTPLLPPPDTASANTGNGLLPPPELYAKNPKNLPIVPEPVTNKPLKVRQLSDFAEADTSQPDANKVAIPQNLRPRLAATDFPKLEVLSFIPGKGVIAYANGREGVLLIGESLNGWELAAVSADNAQFKTGRQSRTVTADNQND